MHLLWEFDYYCFFEGLAAELVRNFGSEERETHWHTDKIFMFASLKCYNDDDDDKNNEDNDEG